MASLGHADLRKLPLAAALALACIAAFAVASMSGYLLDGSVAAPEWPAAGGLPAMLRVYLAALFAPEPHKPLWPLNALDIAQFGLGSFALILAASGGIGGGGLLVPLYLVVGGFSTSAAVALSNVTILGGTLVNFWFNSARRHPLRDARLINWDLILVMEPSTIIGAIFGGYINHVLPGWITTVALAALLAFISYRLVLRSIIMRREDTQGSLKMQQSLREPESLGDVRAAASSADGVHASPASVLEAYIPDPGAAAAASAAAGDGSFGNGSLEEPLLEAVGSELGEVVAHPRSPALAGEAGRRRRRRFDVPLPKFAVLLALVAGVVASNLAKGQLHCPSLAYWAAAVAIVPVIAVLLYFVRRHLLRKVAARAARRSGDLSDGDVDDVAWTPRTTLLYPALCTFAGVCAGMFGVGGGIVKGPLMLEMGVHPLVAAASSATMILFTSASASVVFISFGTLPADYGAAVFALGVVCTAAGQLLTSWISKRLKSKTLIVELMAAVMALSTVVLAIQGGFVTREAALDGALWKWGTVCGVGSVDDGQNQP